MKRTTICKRDNRISRKKHRQDVVSTLHLCACESNRDVRENQARDGRSKGHHAHVEAKVRGAKVRAHLRRRDGERTRINERKGEVEHPQPI